MNMKLDILLSCMNQDVISLIQKTGITGGATVIHQCDEEKREEYFTDHGRVSIFHTTERGLTKSRNMAIRKSRADICILCDDDEVFVQDYENRIIKSYEKLSDADVIIFNMTNRKASFENKVQRLKFPKTMKVSSWQISFRRNSILKAHIHFDELLGAGTGNGAEEELKFLLDCERAKLNIYYVPLEIASVEQKQSTWFHGFTEQFFYNRGATTRYILGLPLAFAYGMYYVFAKKKLYSSDISSAKAFYALSKGIMENKICKQAKESR